jgi:hypothetical protein
MVYTKDTFSTDSNREYPDNLLYVRFFIPAWRSLSMTKNSLQREYYRTRAIILNTMSLLD